MEEPYEIWIKIWAIGGQETSDTHMGVKGRLPYETKKEKENDWKP